MTSGAPISHSSHRSLPIWRSLLYVPVNVARFVDSAARSHADALILDLEDSILPEDKATARAALPAVIAQLAQAGSAKTNRLDLLVRINSHWRLVMQDLEAAVLAGVRAVVLPKVRNAEHVVMIAEIIGSLEEERRLPMGGIGIVPLIETPAALSQAEAIAGAHDRVLALSLGDEDFCTAAGCRATEETLLHPKQKVSLAAHQAGVLALGYIGTLANYRDLHDFPAILKRARDFGYTGAPCIHPSQIAHLNAAFRPSPDEVDHARRLLNAAETQAQSSIHAPLQAPGRGAFALDGKMIDKPALDRARITLDLARRIAEKDGSAA